MNPTELLKECITRGIVLEAANGQLRYRAPKGVMKDDFKEILQRNKMQLIRILKGDYYDSHIQAVITEFNYLGISVLDVPKATRNRSLELELKLTEAANRGDREEFLMFLREWRSCFH